MRGAELPSRGAGRHGRLRARGHREHEHPRRARGCAVRARGHRARRGRASRGHGHSSRRRHTVKNVMGKSRKPDNPYLVLESADGWRWKVLKPGQADNRKPYARWFCYVTSPFTFGSGDMGDTYVSDVVEYGSLTYADPSVFPA